PHLVWYHRGERRIVEYGSSFAAVRAAGTRQALLDAIFNMNEQHLGAEAVTVFEALEDAGFTTAAINFTCYRGRNRHVPAVPAVRPAEFLARYAVLICADHGQTRIDRTLQLEERFADAGVIVTASNRAGMVYRTDATREDTRELATRLDSEPGAEAVLFLEGDEAVARHAGEELRFAPAAGGWGTSGDPALLLQPDALERAWAALRNPNAGELLVSAGDGVEFADLAGRSHLGGGSHGALSAADSEVPLLA